MIGYVNTSRGQVHARWGGNGPVVVLLHDMPGSSATLPAALTQELMATHTVFAPDLIGAGGTTVDDSLAADIDVQATVLAEALRAAGIQSAPVAGDGVGAVVAQRMVELFGDQVTAAVALSMPYSGAEQPPAMPVPDPAGGHLLQLFDEICDGFAFRPWWQPRKENRRDTGRPGPEVLHTALLDTADHGDAHRRLAATCAQLPQPSLELAGDDPVHTIDGLAAGIGEVRMDNAPAPQGNYRDYVTTSIGPLHVRRSGTANRNRPLLLLHANPGSGVGLEPLAEAFGSTRETIIWDTPGHGRSVDLPDPLTAPTMASDYAPLLLELLDNLGIDTFDVYGTHTGAGLAAELAILVPDRIGAVILDGVPLFDDQPQLISAVMDHYFIDLTPDSTGSQIRRAWGASRDMALWWPWFNHTPEGIRAVDAYAPEVVHRVALDMLRSAPHYDRSYKSAWQWECTERLPLLQSPVLVGSTRTDPLAAMTPMALELLGERATEMVFHPLGAPGSVEANAALMTTYLDSIPRSV